MTWIIIAGWVLVTLFTTAVGAHMSAKEFHVPPTGDDWFIGVICGVFWPLVWAGFALMTLAKMFGRQAEWVVLNGQERAREREMRVAEKQRRIAEMEKELGIT